MTRRRAIVPSAAKGQVRCAIYTRKSSDEGLQQEFNSLDAQREAAEAYVATQTERLAVERQGVERGLARAYAEIRRLASTHTTSPAASGQIARLNDEVREAERRLKEIATETEELAQEVVNETDLTAAFADFDNVWRTLSPREQAQLVHMLVVRFVEDRRLEVPLELLDPGSLQARGLEHLAGVGGRAQGRCRQRARRPSTRPFVLPRRPRPKASPSMLITCFA
jgi:hypothetical protein